MREYIFLILIAAVVTYVATPAMRALAIRLHAYTSIRDRDVHAVVTPRLGGVAMYLGFAAALLVASVLPSSSKQMFAGDALGCPGRRDRGLSAGRGRRCAGS